MIQVNDHTQESLDLYSFKTLHFLIRYQYQDLVIDAIENGSDIHTADADGSTALSLSRFYKLEKVTSLLIQKGCN